MSDESNFTLGNDDGADAPVPPLDVAGDSAFDPVQEEREVVLDEENRSLEEESEATEDMTADGEAHERSPLDEDQGDAAWILDAPRGPAEPLSVPMRWDPYADAHHIAIELKHLEEEVRQLLEPLDPRRKRKFSGTRRWHELEDDLRALRFTGRFPEATIVKILQLIARRHTLFRRLNFLSATRPTWNT